MSAIKAIGVAEPADLALADAYEAADALLIDAKPPKGARCRAATASPSTGASRAASPRTSPWILSGGLTPEMSAAPSGTAKRVRSMCRRASRARRASRTRRKSTLSSKRRGRVSRRSSRSDWRSAAWRIRRAASWPGLSGHPRPQCDRSFQHGAAKRRTPMRSRV